MSISIRRLTTILSKASKGRHGAEMAKKLRETAKNSVAYDLKNETSFEIPGMIRLFKSFAEEIGELDSHIEEIFETIDSPIRDLPGIGAKTGPIIVAETGDLMRF